MTLIPIVYSNMKKKINPFYILLETTMQTIELPWETFGKLQPEREKGNERQYVIKITLTDALWPVGTYISLGLKAYKKVNLTFL